MHNELHTRFAHDGLRNHSPRELQNDLHTQCAHDDPKNHPPSELRNELSTVNAHTVVRRNAELGFCPYQQQPSALLYLSKTPHLHVRVAPACGLGIHPEPPLPPAKSNRAFLSPCKAPFAFPERGRTCRSPCAAASGCDLASFTTKTEPTTYNGPHNGPFYEPFFCCPMPSSMAFFGHTKPFFSSPEHHMGQTTAVCPGNNPTALCLSHIQTNKQNPLSSFLETKPRPVLSAARTAPTLRHQRIIGPAMKPLAIQH